MHYMRWHSIRRDEVHRKQRRALEALSRADYSQKLNKGELYITVCVSKTQVSKQRPVDLPNVYQTDTVKQMSYKTACEHLHVRRGDLSGVIATSLGVSSGVMPCDALLERAETGNSLSVPRIREQRQNLLERNSRLSRVDSQASKAEL
eukprot:6256798-Amphidinium_carterae.1